MWNTFDASTTSPNTNGNVQGFMAAIPHMVYTQRVFILDIYTNRTRFCTKTTTSTKETAHTITIGIESFAPSSRRMTTVVLPPGTSGFGTGVGEYSYGTS